MAVQGTLRLALKPLLDQLPVAGGIKASFLGAPDFSHRLHVLGGELNAAELRWSLQIYAPLPVMHLPRLPCHAECRQPVVGARGALVDGLIHSTLPAAAFPVPRGPHLQVCVG